MLTHTIAACSLLAAASLSAALPVIDNQVPLLFQGSSSSSAHYHPLNAKSSYDSDKEYTATFGASHLSEWCAQSKQHFLRDLKNNKAQDWVVVTGNEAGGELGIPFSRALNTHPRVKHDARTGWVRLTSLYHHSHPITVHRLGLSRLCHRTGLRPRPHQACPAKGNRTPTGGEQRNRSET